MDETLKVGDEIEVCNTYGWCLAVVEATDDATYPGEPIRARYVPSRGGIGECFLQADALNAPRVCRRARSQVPDLSGAIEEMVKGVSTAELQAVEAACYRIITAIGIEAFKARTERRRHDGGGPGPLAGRAHELAVDGVVIWRGWWEPESGTRSTWRTLWLVEPETLRR